MSEFEDGVVGELTSWFDFTFAPQPVPEEETGSGHANVGWELGLSVRFAQWALGPLPFLITKIDWPNNEGNEPFVETGGVG